MPLLLTGTRVAVVSGPLLDTRVAIAISQHGAVIPDPVGDTRSGPARDQQTSNAKLSVSDPI